MALRVCTWCHRCRAHCTCEFCVGCREWHPASWGLDSSCRIARAEYAVQAARDEQARGMLGPVPWRERNGLRFGKDSRFLGLEIEIFGYSHWSQRLRSLCDQWDIGVVYDGSVPEGLEIQLPPATLEQLEQILTDLLPALKEVNAIMDGACGLHVHVDQEESSPEELAKLLSIYLAVQDHLYARFGSGRRNNEYCWPLIAEEVKPTERDWGTSRYRGLNFQAMSRHTTVEYRIHGGTLDQEEILTWASVVSGLSDLASGTIQSLDIPGGQEVKDPHPNSPYWDEASNWTSDW